MMIFTTIHGTVEASLKSIRRRGSWGWIERDIADAVRVCDTKGQLSKHYQVS